MPIDAVEIIAYKSKTVSDAGANGGRINDAAAIQEGVVGSYMPNVTSAELTSGLTRYRKVFERVEDTENGVLSDVRRYLNAPYDGEYHFYLLAGNFTDTQGALSSTARYESGILDASVIAGATTVAVTVKDGAITTFRNGDKIVIWDGTNLEEKTINGAPSVAVDVVTLTLDSGLANGYTAATPNGSGGWTAGSTFVGSVLQLGDVEAEVEPGSVTVTSGAGTFDSAQVVVPNKGSVYHQITLTFTSATNFNADSDVYGAGFATGNRSSTFAPINSVTGTSLFEIPSSAYGGTFAAGNTIVFRTKPAVMAMWLLLTVPAGTGAANGLNPTINGIGNST